MFSNKAHLKECYLKQNTKDDSHSFQQDRAATATGKVLWKLKLPNLTKAIHRPLNWQH